MTLIRYLNSSSVNRIDKHEHELPQTKYTTFTVGLAYTIAAQVA